MTDLKLVLADIAKSLVDFPEEVIVNVTEEEDDDITLELSVSENDMGKVIGRHGRIAKAIRMVMKAAANADGKRVKVDIVDR